MNERIRELAEQANARKLDWAYYRGEKKPGTAVDLHSVDLELFAELLIRECISKCEFVANMATITNTGEMARKTKATADSCATMIKQHFGVEE